MGAFIARAAAKTTQQDLFLLGELYQGLESIILPSFRGIGKAKDFTP